MIRPVYNLLSYYFTLFLFGTLGVLLNIFAVLAGVVPDSQRTERFFQRLIQRCFALFHWWCEFARLVYVRYHGFEKLPLGVVLVANHPALIDITCLLARLPAAVCIFKPAIRRNPVLGAAARRAGYVASDGGHELVTRVAAQIARGNSLVVFPEGTRTPPGQPLLPFKPGFVLIARRARAPIQLVRIVTDSDVLTKGRPWWWLPKFPAHIAITAGPLLAVDSAASTVATAQKIEAWFRTPQTRDVACADDVEEYSSSSFSPL